VEGLEARRYAEVMNSGAVQALLKKKADAAAASCNSSFSRHPGEGVGYVVRKFKGKLANGFVVATATPHAHASERKHNRLRSMFGGGE
jgi:hypothetical protein